MMDLLFGSLQDQRTALKKREISSVELILAHYDQIERTNPAINALVQLARERALDEARQADAMSGEDNRILHGIPFTVKDSLDTEGIITATGTMGFKNRIPKRDAAIVQRLRQAGAIVLGKTNSPEMVMPFETDNLVYGRTNNPWHLDHTPGGSSGGEGAAIASGCSPLGVAGDAGASIRMPAHFCGITGIKPTTGRVPRTGHTPMMGGATGPMAAVGPLARTVDDLILVLPLLCGADGVDAGCVPVPYYDPHQVEIDQLKVAFYVDNGIMAADDETAQAVYHAATILEKAGATIHKTCPPDMESHLEIFTSLFNADGGVRIRQYLERIGTEEISVGLRVSLDRMPQQALSTADFMSVMGRWERVRSQMLGFMQHYDAILCPVIAHPAPKHGGLLGEDNMQPVSYTMTYNLVGYPSASVPVTQSTQGLPIGVQVVAGAWREDVVLALARTIEQETGGYQKPPLVRNN